VRFARRAVSSARALGLLCSKEALSELTRRAVATGASSSTWPVQSAAIEALAQIGPADLAERLKPLQKYNAAVLRDALTRALSPHKACVR
jgi:HEAT repeat protein